jgi:hypothetical protein
MPLVFECISIQCRSMTQIYTRVGVVASSTHIRSHPTHRVRYYNRGVAARTFDSIIVTPPSIKAWQVLLHQILMFRLMSLIKAWQPEF